MKYMYFLIGLILLIFMGLPYQIIYAKTGIQRWIPLILILGGVPFLLYKTLQDWDIDEGKALLISIVSILIIGPLFGLWSDKIADNDLEKYGVIQNGIVIEKWYSNINRNNEWLYKASFQVNKTIYKTFSITDKYNTINIGDTVLIKYSKINPENNIIIETK